MTSDVVALQVLMEEGVAAHQRSDFAAAEERYREVLRRAPEHTDATHFLGLLAHQTGHNDAALPLLQRAIELGPNNHLYRHNLAGVLQALGRSAEAEQRYHEALARKPDYLDALIGLAKAQEAQNHFQDALVSYTQVLALAPKHFEALLGRGATLAELMQRDTALASYREARTLAWEDADKLQRVGLALHALDTHSEARDCFERALVLRPDFVEAHACLGITLADMGDLRNAEAHYREALRLKPGHVGAYYNLISLIRLKRDDPLWAPLMALAEKLESRPLDERIQMHFALGKVWEDASDYQRAFWYFLEGNRLKHAGSNYDEARQMKFYRDAIRYFDAGFLATRADAGIRSDSPIFIIGMSRSGTTLVEQILASHPQVYGAGEIQWLRQSVYAELGPLTKDEELPRRLVQLDNAAIARIGARYLKAATELAPAAARVTDKLPGNVVLVGLMHLAFPHAHIIYCAREPLDTCVSCFSKLFTTGHDFSYELGELGRFYRLYEELMQHWLRVLPLGRILEVRYEEVVSDLEVQARRLVEFCGLDWDDACLRFYESVRPVRTASLAQVRRPIYASSVGRWRHYEKYLDPLKQALAGTEYSAKS